LDGGTHLPAAIQRVLTDASRAREGGGAPERDSHRAWRGRPEPAGVQVKRRAGARCDDRCRRPAAA
jgi:hypothetical protein